MTTRAEAVSWANGGWKSSSYVKDLGGGAGVDVDGYYGLQCADFPNAYSLHYGWGRFSGDAWQFWDTAPSTYQKVQDPLPGDIFVLANAYNNAGGHTGIVTEVRNGRNSWVAQSQNFVNSNSRLGSPPVPAVFNANQLRGFLRPPLTEEDMTQYFTTLPDAIGALDRVARSQGFPQWEHNGEKIVAKLERNVWTGDLDGALGYLDKDARALGFDKYEGNQDAIAKKIASLTSGSGGGQFEKVDETLYRKK